MLKKIFTLTNLESKNNLYLSNIIASDMAKDKKLIPLIFSKNNAYFFNLKINIC